MICSKCGKTIPDGSVFCMVCGEKVSEDNLNDLNDAIADEQERIEIETSDQTDQMITTDNTDQTIPEEPKSKKPKKKIIILAVVASIVLIGIIIGVIVLVSEQSKAAGMENLQKNMQGEWYRTDADAGDLMYILELDIDEYGIEYIFVSPLIVETISDYDYTIISPNQFYVDNFKSSPYTVTFSNNNTTMKITPALTSTESSEIWFKID